MVAFVVLGSKSLAYLATGSVALISDAVESIVNIASACVAVIALRISAAPADENHPFGHTKVEYFVAVGEGVLIVVAGPVTHSWHRTRSGEIRPFNADATAFRARPVADKFSGVGARTSIGLD